MPVPNDHDRLFRYVEGFFARRERTAFPTIRQAAKSLGWTHERLEGAIEGDPEGRLFTSSYFAFSDPPFGEHFIESYTS